METLAVLYGIWIGNNTFVNHATQSSSRHSIRSPLEALSSYRELETIMAQGLLLAVAQKSDGPHRGATLRCTGETCLQQPEGLHGSGNVQQLHPLRYSCSPYVCRFMLLPSIVPRKAISANPHLFACIEENRGVDS